LDNAIDAGTKTHIAYAAAAAANKAAVVKGKGT